MNGRYRQALKDLELEVAAVFKLYKCSGKHYILAEPGKNIVLDGPFTQEQLEALADWMREPYTV